MRRHKASVYPDKIVQTVLHFRDGVIQEVNGARSK